MGRLGKGDKMTEKGLEFTNDYTDAVFLGIGGCGINTISRLRKSGVKGIRTLCISRFKEELLVEGENVVNFALLGKKADPERYLRSKSPVSLEERADAEKRIRETVKGAKKVLLFAGLGGFTGTAIVPVAASVTKAEGATLGMVLTYPFKLERKRCEAAEKSCPELQKLADECILMKNDDLAQTFREMPLNDAFKLRDMKIADAIRAGGKRE